MVKKRISSNIEINLAEQLDAAAAALGMTRARYIEMAIKAELEHLDHRKEMNKACETAVKAIDDQVRAENSRKAAVAANQQLSNTLDTLKAKHEDSESELRVVKAKLKAYENQGVIGRLFGRVPEPDMEPETA